MQRCLPPRLVPASTHHDEHASDGPEGAPDLAGQAGLSLRMCACVACVACVARVHVRMCCTRDVRAARGSSHLQVHACIHPQPQQQKVMHKEAHSLDCFPASDPRPTHTHPLHATTPQQPQTTCTATRKGHAESGGRHPRRHTQESQGTCQAIDATHAATPRTHKVHDERLLRRAQAPRLLHPRRGQRGGGRRGGRHHAARAKPHAGRHAAKGWGSGGEGLHSGLREGAAPCPKPDSSSACWRPQAPQLRATLRGSERGWEWGWGGGCAGWGVGVRDGRSTWGAEHPPVLRPPKNVLTTLRTR